MPPRSSSFRRSAPPVISATARLPVAGAGQRIGLMGGSFNPPHAGHLRVAETAMKRLRLDAVWWLVTPGNPLKDKTTLPPLAERMAACRRLAGHRRIRVSGLEAEIRTSFTADTLGFLLRRARGVRFVWLMGADNLAQFQRWRDWRGIAARVPLAVVDRPGWRLPALASPAGRTLASYRLPEPRADRLPGRRPPAWVLLTTRLSPLSSSDLRRRENGDIVA